MDALSLIILVLGSALSIWASSLVARALAERAEIRAAANKRRLLAAGAAGAAPVPTVGRSDRVPPHPHSTPETTVEPGLEAGAGSGRTDAPTVKVNPTRNVLVFSLAPVVFALGLVVCWIALGLARMGDVLPWVKAIGITVVLVALGQFQVAAALACAGWWFDSARGRRRCPKCWYDLSPATGRLCTECGHEAPNERSLYRTRRKHGLLWISLLVALATYLTIKAHATIQYGVFSLVPTTLLVATFEHWPDPLVQREVSNGTQANPASLGNRISRGEVFDWQRHWLKGRRTKLVRTSEDPRLITRAMKGVTRSYDDRLELQRHLSPAMLEHLFLLVGDPNAEERAAAAEMLQYVLGYSEVDQVPASWEAPARAAAPRVVASLRDPNTTVAWIAAQIIDWSNIDIELPLDGIAADIRADTSVRREIARSRLISLGALARRSDAAAELLLEFSRSTVADHRRFSVYGLWRSLKHRPPYAARLYEMMDDPAVGVSAAAANSLARIDRSDAFLGRLLGLIESRTSGQDWLFDALDTQLQQRQAAGTAGCPPWAADRLMALLVNPEQSLLSRSHAATKLEYWAPETPGLLDAMRVLAKEPFGSTWELEELTSKIRNLEEAEAARALASHQAPAEGEATQAPSAEPATDAAESAGGG